LFSNGIDIFGIEILPLEDMFFFQEEKLVSFHGWGNGDFDCISINSDESLGKIFFVNHSVDNIIPLCSSITEWILGAIKEVEVNGTLLHPYDYEFRENEEGMYKNVRKYLYK
jgi:hypothetical protein